MAASLSSTNIAELLQAELESIKEVQQAVLKSKLTSKALKDVAARMDSMIGVIESIGKISQALAKIKLQNPAKTAITKLALKQMFGLVEQIVDFCAYIKKNAKTIDGKALSGIVTLTDALSTISKSVLAFTLISGFGLVFIGGMLSLLALRGFIWVFSKLFNKDTVNEMKTAGKAIREMALTILLLSTSVMVLVLTGILIGESTKEFLLVIGYLLTVTMIFFLVSLVVKFMKETKTDQGILYIAGTVMMLALSVVALVLAGQLINEEWENILMVGAYLLILVGAFALIGFASKWIKSGTKDMLYIAATVAILSATVFILVAASYLVNDNWENLLMVGAFVAILVGAIIGISFASSMMKSGLKTVIIMSIAITVICGSMFILSAASEKLSWSSIGMTLTLVGAFTAVVIGLGIPYVAAFAATGAGIMMMIAGAILMVSTSMLLIATSIEKIMSLGLTEDDASVITMPISIMGETCKAIADSISMKDLARATGKAAMLAIVTKCLGSMASTIADVAALRIPTEFDKDGNPKSWRSMTQDDFVNATLSAVAITTLLTGMFADEKQEITLPGGQKVSFDPISQDALSNITWKTKRKIKQLSEITTAIGEMAKVIRDVATLSIPTEFDKDGKGIKWEKMTQADFVTASENVAIIATTILNALTNEQISEQLENMRKSSIKKMEMIFEACGNIGNLVEAIKSVSVMSVPVEFNKDGTVKAYKILTDEEIEQSKMKVVDIMTFFLKAIASEELSDILGSMSKKAAKNLDTIMQSCGGINDLLTAVEKASSFDEEKIGTGIARMQAVLVGYGNMLHSLFYESSHIECDWKSGIFGIPYPSFRTVIDATALIDMSVVEKAAKNLKTVQNTIDPFKNIVESLNNIQAPEDSTNDKKKRVPLDVLTDYITTVGTIEKMNDSKVKKNVDNLTKFIDKSNSVNVDKIKTVTEMFAKLAEFSATIDGNFERLADVLDGKLSDTLTKIANTLKQIEQKPVGKSQEDKKPIVGGEGKQPQQKQDFSELTEKIDDLVDNIGAFVSAVRSSKGL